MKAKNLFLAFSMFIPLFSFGSAYKWDLESSAADTLHTDGSGSVHVRTTVSYSENGQKYVYFSLSDYDMVNDKTSNTDFCDPVGFSDKGIIKLNGQAIQVYRWCKPFEHGGHFLQLTARTIKGESFVRTALLHASQSVLLEVDGRSYEISADGFTAVWNKSSDVAL